MTDHNDTTLFFDRSELLEAQQSPEYGTSARYRADVAAKLERSLTAGTITPLGHRHTPNEASTLVTRNGRIEEGVVYGGVQPLPGPSPLYKAALEVGRPGSFFDGPEDIAMAMAAPHFDIDESYRNAVREKIGRSIREGRIDTNFQTIPRVAAAHRD
jgi:hypothetical protein